MRKGWKQVCVPLPTALLPLGDAVSRIVVSVLWDEYVLGGGDDQMSGANMHIESKALQGSDCLSPCLVLSPQNDLSGGKMYFHVIKIQSSQV